MTISMSPSPGQRRIAFVGDVLRFHIQAPAGMQARRGILRTSIGHEALLRAAARSGRDEADPEAWRDVEMQAVGDGFAIALRLCDVGAVEAKARLVDAGGVHHWPPGANVRILVHPAWTRRGNILYCAFVRQFGPARELLHAAGGIEDGVCRALEEHGYATLPPSGKFRDLLPQLDHIFHRLHCRILHLLPICPTPTTYARFGRFGSPYAGLDLTGIDPALVEFDTHTTAVDQFCELTDAVHRRGGRVFIDLAINHTGWGSQLQNQHPEWFSRKPDGSFQCPGAWDVVWEDLVELRYDSPAIVEHLADAFLTWCERGVDGFRCDAGYMVPTAIWAAIVARVQEHYPDTIFLLEGLGGSWQATEERLVAAGMHWAYSELFQNHDPQTTLAYLAHCDHASQHAGLLVHYSETHDNARLAASGRAWSLMRNRLCALAAQRGGFGFTAGVEWLATEKILVHGASGLNWGAQEHIIDELAALNRLLAQHPCFGADAEVLRLQTGGSPVLVWQRRHAASGSRCLVVINTDSTQSRAWQQDLSLWREYGEPPVDLLSGRHLEELRHGQRLSLQPGEAVVCAAQAWTDDGSAATEADHFACLQALCLACRGLLSPEQLAQVPEHLLTETWQHSPAFALAALSALAADPGSDFKNLLAALPGRYLPVVPWRASDSSRVRLLPAEHWLLVRHPHAFQLQIRHGARFLYLSSCPQGDSHACVLAPGRVRGRVQLRLRDLTGTTLRGSLQCLPLERLTTAGEEPYGTVLLTNGRGGMAHIPTLLGRITSKYDCFLAANLDPRLPCDRHIFVKNLRFFLQIDGIGHAIDAASIIDVTTDHRQARWQLALPIGGGHRVTMELWARMLPGANTTDCFLRLTSAAPRGSLLIVRVDIEDRNFHTETVFNEALAAHFQASLVSDHSGFSFTPGRGRGLRVSATDPAWQDKPEWLFEVPHPVEAERGLRSHGDAWSPGYFAFGLDAGREWQLRLDAEAPAARPPAPLNADPHWPELASFADDEEALQRACENYLVRRDDWKSVIAGYPWFLDWGRDTLICARGLLAAGHRQAVLEILQTFGRFADRGTLPNCIHGADASNRDTSDAPLWYGVVVDDLFSHSEPSQVSAVEVGGRSLTEVLQVIANGYRHGTPNGIRMDPDSGLIWSPSHFTWMDTNHPAGSPRAGYPIEIQALWWRLLRQMARLAAADQLPDEGWAALADQVQASVERYFWDPQRGWLADQLASSSGKPAAAARIDGALRCNALMAISLGMITGPAAQATVLAAERYLIVPGAIRSLAPLPVEVPLPVRGRDGRLLNDPQQPYQGTYSGDEDTRRKVAYHNGTAWTWPFPHFCEALLRAWPGDAAARGAAASYLQSYRCLLTQGCVDQIPEICDGDAPHRQRGCDAQAWGVTEIVRLQALLRRS